VGALPTGIAATAVAPKKGNMTEVDPIRVDGSGPDTPSPKAVAAPFRKRVETLLSQAHPGRDLLEPDPGKHGIQGR
jgi:hypothetical protein